MVSFVVGVGNGTEQQSGASVYLMAAEQVLRDAETHNTATIFMSYFFLEVYVFFHILIEILADRLIV